jgi:hypothetical protein
LTGIWSVITNLGQLFSVFVNKDHSQLALSDFDRFSFTRLFV